MLPKSETLVILRRLIPSTTYYVWAAAVVDHGKASESRSHLVGPLNFTTVEEGISMHYMCVSIYNCVCLF